MELYKAIHKILKDNGRNLIADEKLINFLSDFQAFDVRATRRVMQAFLQLGFGRKVLELDKQNDSEKMLQIDSMSLQLTQQGFQRRYVNYVLQSVCCGLGWQGELPNDIEEEYTEASVDRQHVAVSGGVSFDMISVAGGSFDMGGTQEQGMYASFDEKPPVQVSVSAFFMSETPVTQRLWAAVMGDNPSHFKGADLPVERVSWNDCQMFVKELHVQTGIAFRLPTEAEWEYAARGGSQSRHCKYAGANDYDDYVWCKENSLSHSHEVKSKLPNELGLYDMCGNVSEWCSDWYFNSYVNNGSKINPTGPSAGKNKVYRGGSWNAKAVNCRVSKRYSMSPILKDKLVGLRLAVTLL